MQKQLPTFNTRPTTYDDILNAFLKGETITLRTICTRCGRAKTPLMARLVQNLVDSGALLKTGFTTRQGASGFEYTINPDIELGLGG